MSQHNNGLIAIVDDDPLVRAATSSLVRSFGWEARAFASGAELLASDALARTRCLVCDVQMPGMDGIELLDTLGHQGIHIPTIFITAFATARMRERVGAGAALCMIEKPIDAGELETWIGRALGQE
ncbi:response regulator [Paraburkholderia sp. C35]|uniref:response regulator transcription factor n=1 Tax=Paraburkholderia sp. C35 TaxID=2126993 RepID=UPI000D68B772|nr:response regulator [Paraburkholderia sp. C35]